jgi:hypothetical protein
MRAPAGCSANRPRKRSYVCNAPVPIPGPDGCRKGKLRIIAEPLEEYVVKSVMAPYLESLVALVVGGIGGTINGLLVPALAQAFADQVRLPLTIRPCVGWRRSRSHSASTRTNTGSSG